MDRIRLVRNISLNTLPTESASEFEEERQKIRKALKPQNRIEEIYTEDFTDDTWLSRRARRAQTQAIKAEMPHALYDLLRELGIQDGEAAQLAEGWLQGEPEDRNRVNAILQQHGLGDVDLEGIAVRRSLHDLIRCEQLVTSSAARRDKALGMFTLARQVTGAEAKENAPSAIGEPRLVRLERAKRKAAP